MVKQLHPTPDDAAAARESLAVLEQQIGLEADEEHGIAHLTDLPLPTAALPLVTQMLTAMVEGHAVSLHVDTDTPLSTTQAADLLNVSRPTLINMCEAGHVSFYRVGTHRRVSRTSLLAYKQQMESGAVTHPRPSKQEQLRAVREIVRIGLEAGEEF